MPSQVTENKSENSAAGWSMRHLMRQLATLVMAIVFLGLAVAGVAALHIRSASEPLPGEHPPVSVQTMRLEIQPSYHETVRYVGRLEAARQTALAFERPGLVTTVRMDEGDRVAAGDVVAMLDTAQLEASRKQREAQIRELEARLDLARLTLERQTKLRENGWSPEQRFDEASTALDELSAAIDRVKAQISSIDIDIEKSQLKAPFDGVIAARSIDEGAVIAAGTPILTILEDGHRQLRVGLPPEVAAKLDKATTYQVQTLAGPVAARLYASRPDLQSATRTVTALFDVKTGDATPFGEIVTLLLEREIDERGAWVPLAALQESDRGLWSLLTVAEKDGKPIVRREAAEVLHVDGAHAYVRGTFEPGASVIANGTNRVVPGQLVALAGS
ncbi:MAG: efflux RND transporter periplasmic adaptor subunit [Methyloceanibacter sp.]|nr:efflux RND transporter periplasmic adaptor subunit [Methyloceanibacter sp.]